MLLETSSSLFIELWDTWRPVDVAITSRLLYYFFGQSSFLVSLLTFWRFLYFLILEMCSYRSAHSPPFDATKRHDDYFFGCDREKRPVDQSSYLMRLVGELAEGL